MDLQPPEVLNLQNVAVAAIPQGWLLEHCIYNRSTLREEIYIYDGV